MGPRRYVDAAADGRRREAEALLATQGVDAAREIPLWVAKARRKIGYVPPMSSEAGLAEMKLGS